LESAKGDTFSSAVINDVLYGAEDGSELLASMDEMKYYEQLRNWSSEQWSTLLRKYYVDPPAVVVIGRPSAKLQEKLEKDELRRVEEQVKQLGPEGLKRAEALLEEAKDEHERPLPGGLLSTFPVPDVKSISWIPVETVQEPGSGRQVAKFASQSPSLKQQIDADGKDLPFFVEYDQVDVRAVPFLSERFADGIAVRFCYCSCFCFIG
jgi:Zn-dependent M16 (insulinase) family peptidase